MRFPVTCQTDRLDERIAEVQSAISGMEEALWAGGLEPRLLADYQAAFRQQEELIAARGSDDRHRFVVVIPVADCPQQLRNCLDSLLELCRTFCYGGQSDGSYRKVSVLIADDSRDSRCIDETRELASEFSQLGIATEYFGIDEQLAVVECRSPAEQADLAGFPKLQPWRPPCAALSRWPHRCRPLHPSPVRSCR